MNSARFSWRNSLRREPGTRKRQSLSYARVFAKTLPPGGSTINSGSFIILELRDPKTAAEIFLEGSRIAGAMPWMKTMAAHLAQDAGERETARYLWTQIYRDSESPTIRANAYKRLIALQVDEEVDEIAGAWPTATGARPVWSRRASCNWCRPVT